MGVVTFFVWNKFKIVNSVIQAVIVINILTELIVCDQLNWSLLCRLHVNYDVV